MRNADRRLVTVLAGVVLATCVVGAAGPAGAADPVRAGSGAGDVPDDRPLPPYTINNPPLPPANVGGAPARVLQGVHRHAAFDIEIPPRWNGELVMWAHGFRGNGTVLTVDPPAFGLRQRLLDQGYAWAASSYYANAYDVRAGVLSTHDLAEHFAEVVDRPRRTYIAGVSMGGHVVGRSLEQFPRFYAGALPLCGVLGDHELFDFFLDYGLTAQAVSGIRAFPPPPDYQTVIVPRIQRALGLAGLTPGGPDTTNDVGKQFRAIIINRSGGPRPGDVPSFAMWKDFLFGRVSPGGGDTLATDPDRIATNLAARYVPNAPVDVNATVQRVPPGDPVSRRTARLTQIPSIAGRPRVPVLSLHDLGDMFVPFGMEQDYRADVDRHGQRGLLVQRAVRAAGHCEFTSAEVLSAWDDLTRWVHRGTRPAGDDVRTPSVVADPRYGCRFSDRGAWSSPPPGSTRRLFASCD
jgi:hypothetical protein